MSASPPNPYADDFTVMVGRLNKLSVERHFDAYVDIDWDDPEFALDPTDPRFELSAIDPLRHTDWYASLSPADRASLGCYRWAACMKTGWQFENLLQRGLLRHAFALPNGGRSSATSTTRSSRSRSTP